jgi:hypoxanthine-guanine phosphoribosyltransferase
MLDKPEKTYQLLAALKAAVPFEVELTPPLVMYLQAQQVAVASSHAKSCRKSHMRVTKAASSATSFPSKAGTRLLSR